MTVAIVGAGVTGLACAAQLGRAAIVVDRVPVCGGVLGWDDAATRRLEAAARGAGAGFALGETAITWDGELLVTMGQDGARRIPAAALVIAGGARPLNRAELRIDGDRPHGVVSATVACHLAETGVVVGRRPAIVGDGDWARRAEAELRHAGAEPLRVAGRPLAVRGTVRVEELVCDDGTVACDAVVLAHGLVPLRNVDGAVADGIRTVYAQPCDDPGTIAGAEEAGRRAAEAALAIMAGT
jgi:Pyridine nucleotide-disulphide oxidoreductase